MSTSPPGDHHFVPLEEDPQSQDLFTDNNGNFGEIDERKLSELKYKKFILIFLSICILISAIIGAVFSPAGFILHFFGAVIALLGPVLFFYTFYYNLLGDGRFKVIDSKSLFYAFLLGFFSAIPVIFIELLISLLLGEMFKDSSGGFAEAMYAFCVAFIVAGCTEEHAKFASVFFVRRKHILTHPYGVVLVGFCAGMGFSAVENLTYLYSATAEGGAFGLIVTGFMRMVVAIPLHCSTGFLIGFGYSVRSFGPRCIEIADNVVESNAPNQPSLGKWIIKTQKNVNYYRNYWGIIVLPILIHGMYDFLLMVQLGIIGLFSFLIVWAVYSLIQLKVFPFIWQMTEVLNLYRPPTSSILSRSTLQIVCCCCCDFTRAKEDSLLNDQFPQFPDELSSLNDLEIPPDSAL